MKSLITKSVYAGLGVLNTGKQNVEHLGHRLAKQAELTEKDGEKIARRLRAQADRKITQLHDFFEAEIKKAVHALHLTARDEVDKVSEKRKKRSPVRKTKSHRRRPVEH